MVLVDKKNNGVFEIYGKFLVGIVFIKSWFWCIDFKLIFKLRLIFKVEFWCILKLILILRLIFF